MMVKTGGWSDGKMINVNLHVVRDIEIGRLIVNSMRDSG